MGRPPVGPSRCWGRLSARLRNERGRQLKWALFPVTLFKKTGQVFLEYRLNCLKTNEQIFSKGPAYAGNLLPCDKVALPRNDGAAGCDVAMCHSNTFGKNG